MPDDPIRILVADDHAIFRDGLRRLLEAEPGFGVAGEAADGDEAVRLAREVPADVLLLDLAMPRRPGLEALREIAAAKLPIRTLLLVANIEEPQLAAALKLGARGVVMKESATEVLINSIRAVMQGELWVGREAVTSRVSARGAPPAADRKARPYGLTNRELEIVATIVDGCTNREIAQRFSLSEDTVKHHLTSIFNKLGVTNRLELAMFAVNNKLLES